jgi:glutathione S-transferase
MYQLYIGNKNYSSWSLRPWVLLHQLGIPFTEHQLYFGHEAHRWHAYRALSPSGKVPCLIEGATVVWDSLAIAEYVAERHAPVWPADPVARAWARSAAAEMHSGFSELRTRCGMSCGMRVRLFERPPALERELTRLAALWSDGLHRFGGPFLAGEAFTAVDAFFAPVAFRIQTYGLTLDPAPQDYAARLLGLAAMQSWYAAALAETVADPPHDAEIRQMGTVLEDFRAVAG